MSDKHDRCHPECMRSVDHNQTTNKNECFYFLIRSYKENYMGQAHTIFIILCLLLLYTMKKFTFKEFN